jgi:hypothetical protein
VARSYDDARDIPEIRTWDDMLQRPAYSNTLSSKSELARVLAPYRHLSPMMPCGLSDCRTPNASGYLIAAADGRETNIGAVCGEKHFPEFKGQARVVDRIQRERDIRARAAQAKQEAARIREAIAALRQEHHGAGWVERLQRGLKRVLIDIDPSLWSSLVRRASTGDAVAKRVRKLSRDERGADREIVTGEGRLVRVRAQDFVEVAVGRFAGLELFLPGRDLHELLVRRLGGLADRLEACAPATDRYKDLSVLLKDLEQLQPDLQLARWTIDAGREFFTADNVALLQYLTTDERLQPKLRQIRIESLGQ